jgi:hypothetical protein
LPASFLAALPRCSTGAILPTHNLEASKYRPQLREAVYDVINAREALGIPENAPLPTREEADAEWRKWEKEHGEQFHEEFEAERVKEQMALNPGKEIGEIDAAVDKLMAPKRR